LLLFIDTFFLLPIALDNLHLRFTFSSSPATTFSLPMASQSAPQSPSGDHGGSDDAVSTTSSKRKLSESNDTNDESDGTPSKRQRSDIPTINVEPSNHSDEEIAQPEPEPEPEPAKRGSRGGGRPRGRGRGRGGRGGRGGAVNSARGTPSRDLLQPPVRGGRGRGGGRVKKSDNARIQSLYHRKRDLKGQFKQVAALQKEALAELSLKSLQSLEDFALFQSLPEFKETTDALTQRFKKATALLDARQRLEAALVNQQLKDAVIYRHREFRVSKLVHVCRYHLKISSAKLQISEIAMRPRSNRKLCTLSVKPRLVVIRKILPTIAV
jgi:hypothetical protein